MPALRATHFLRFSGLNYRLVKSHKIGYTFRRNNTQKGILMNHLLTAPETAAQRLRDALLGVLIGLARATTSEPKTVNTDEVLNAGLRLAAQPDAPAEKLQKMLDIARTEKQAVAPNCATCAMPCGNTADYDLTRLWHAPAALRTLKLRLLDALLTLAEQRPDADAQYVIYQGLFTLAEDWDESLLLPVVQRAEELCRK